MIAPGPPGVSEPHIPLPVAVDDILDGQRRPVLGQAGDGHGLEVAAQGHRDLQRLLDLNFFNPNITYASFYVTLTNRSEQTVRGLVICYHLLCHDRHHRLPKLKLSQLNRWGDLVVAPTHPSFAGQRCVESTATSTNTIASDEPQTATA